MVESKPKPILRACGRGIQFGGALLLIGGLSSIGVRVLKGEWPDIMGVQYSASATACFSLLLVLFGIASLFLGQRVKYGSTRAAGCAAVPCSALLAFVVLHSVRTGRHGWYELALMVFLTTDAWLALLYTITGDDDVPHKQSPPSS